MNLTCTTLLLTVELIGKFTTLVLAVINDCQVTIVAYTYCVILCFWVTCNRNSLAIEVECNNLTRSNHNERVCRIADSISCRHYSTLHIGNKNNYIALGSSINSSLKRGVLCCSNLCDRKLNKNIILTNNLTGLIN